MAHREAKSGSRYVEAVLAVLKGKIERASSRGESLASETNTGKRKIGNLVTFRRWMKNLLEEPGTPTNVTIRRKNKLPTARRRGVKDPLHF